MLFEIDCNVERMKPFKCYLYYKRVGKTHTIIRTARRLYKDQFAYIVSIFKQNNMDFLNDKRGFKCEGDPAEFINTYFNVVDLYDNYYFLHTVRDVEILNELSEKGLFDDNIIFEDKRKNESVYYIKSGIEIDNVLMPYIEKLVVESRKRQNEAMIDSTTI